MRVLLIAVVMLLAACPARTTSYVQVRAYEAAPEPAPFVVVYHPWSVEEAGTPVARGAQRLAFLTGIEVTCEGCSRPTGTGSFEVVAPARGARLVVGKAGFAPVTISVPAGKPTSLTYLVLLRKAP